LEPARGGQTVDYTLLTQNSTPIFSIIVKLLGVIMNIIFEFLNLIGIPNIGLSILLFTIVIYLLLMPLTIKQQKFSKLSAKMNPELQAIRDKYSGKNDQQSMMEMNYATKAVYAKYGVSPSGSCVQLLIQMPILIALYQVIYHIPAYVSKVGEAFGMLADKIIASDGVAYIKELTAGVQYAKNFEIADNTRNAVIDVLYASSTQDIAAISEKFGLADLALNGERILSSGAEIGLIDTYNNFLGLNIANSPMNIMTNAFSANNYLLVIGAVLVPVLAWFTQWMNYKLMPQANTQDDSNKKKAPQSDTAEAMQQSMKTMNTVMPVMSAFFCLSMPAGMGIYWIIGAVVRCVQQVLINKHIDKMDIDAVIKQNEEKYKETLRKQGINAEKLNQYAKMNTRNVNTAPKKPSMSAQEREAAIKKSTEYYNQNAKPGSLAAKANMVKQYNEKNNK